MSSILCVTYVTCNLRYISTKIWLLSMKRTLQDDDFAAHFGRKLNVKYSEAKRSGVTDQVFATSIGVERAQLDRYLRGEAMPSVRTVALAYQKYGITVAYGSAKPHLALRREKRGGEAKPTQLLLPFSIRSEGTENVEVKLRPLGTRKFELQLTIDGPRSLRRTP
jgi:transcriptional regulator with XRE-family HTH domain